MSTLNALKAIKAERQIAETKAQEIKAQVLKLQSQQKLQLEQQATAQSMLRASETALWPIAQKIESISKLIDQQQRIITINSEIEKKGFLRFEDFPSEILEMILVLALPRNTALRLDHRGHTPSLLCVSKTFSSIAIPLFYKINTVVLQNGFPNDFRANLRSHIVRICIRGDIDASLLQDLQKCSNLTYLTLSPNHAPLNRWKRPFQKPNHLGKLTINSQYAKQWEEFINSTEPRPKISSTELQPGIRRSERIVRRV